MTTRPRSAATSVEVRQRSVSVLRRRRHSARRGEVQGSRESSTARISPPPTPPQVGGAPSFAHGRPQAASLANGGRV